MRARTRKSSSKGLSPATVKARRSMASGFFTNLVNLGLLGRNPFATVETPKLKKTVLRSNITFAEAEAIIGGLPTVTWYGARLRVLLGLALHAGARIDEIVTLTWGDINWSAELVTLDGKGDKERNPPLTAWLLQELKCYQATWAGGHRGFDQSPIFIGRKGRRLAHKAVYATIERFGLRSQYGVHPHLFRHLFGTELARTGTRLQDIKYAMGHATVASSEKYVHALALDTIDAIRRLGTSSKLVTPPPAIPAVPIVHTLSTSTAVASSVQWRQVSALPLVA